MGWWSFRGDGGDAPREAAGAQGFLRAQRAGAAADDDDVLVAFALDFGLERAAAFFDLALLALDVYAAVLLHDVEAVQRV